MRRSAASRRCRPFPRLWCASGWKKCCDVVKYVSTRGHSAAQSFTDILLEGLAPDGGLSVPEQWPRIMRAKLDAMRDLPYPRLAFEILRFFSDDYPGADLKAAADPTHTPEAFGTPQLPPLPQPHPGASAPGLSTWPPR